MSGDRPGEKPGNRGPNGTDWLPKPPPRPMAQGLKVILILAALIALVIIISVIAAAA